MNYTGSSCEDYKKLVISQDIIVSVTTMQWTYYNMTTITISGDFICTCTCAGVGGGWRRIANIDISAGDDCLGEWRKATQSGVGFCRVHGW